MNYTELIRSWADYDEDMNPGTDDDFTVVKNKKRRRVSNSPTAAAPSSNIGGARTNRRLQSSAGSVPRAQELRTTMAHIAEARTRQASSSEEHCVYLEHGPELQPFHYLRALDRMLGGTAGVIQISKVNGHQLLGLANRGLAERLINEGLEVEGTLLRAFPFRKRAERITLGNLPFFVEDSAIINALKPYGRITSIAPKMMKAGPYIYCDGRREAFIVLHDGVTTERLPTRLDIPIKGEAWPAYLSSGIKCSRCHGQGHRRANCPLLAGRVNTTRSAPPASPAGLQPSTTPAPPQRPTSQHSAPAPLLEFSGASPAARAAIHPAGAPRPSPTTPSASPTEDTPPAPPPVTPDPSSQAPRDPASQEILGPANITQDIEMTAVEESIPSSASSNKKCTRIDLAAFIKRSPSVSFAGTDALGLGREEVLDLLSSKTKAHKRGRHLTPPQSNALAGLINQILDLRPGGSSNIYKVLRQVLSELRTGPAAVPPTSTLPAPRPSHPTPLTSNKLTPAMITPPPPAPTEMEEDVPMTEEERCVPPLPAPRLAEPTPPTPQGQKTTPATTTPPLPPPDPMEDDDDLMPELDTIFNEMIAEPGFGPLLEPGISLDAVMFAFDIVLRHLPVLTQFDIVLRHLPGLTQFDIVLRHLPGLTQFDIVLRHLPGLTQFDIVLRHLPGLTQFDIVLRHLPGLTQFDIVLRHLPVLTQFDIVLRHLPGLTQFDIVLRHLPGLTQFDIVLRHLPGLTQFDIVLRHLPGLTQFDIVLRHLPGLTQFDIVLRHLPGLTQFDIVLRHLPGLTQFDIVLRHLPGLTQFDIVLRHLPGLPQFDIVLRHLPGLTQFDIVLRHLPGLTQFDIVLRHLPGLPQFDIVLRHLPGLTQFDIVLRHLPGLTQFDIVLRHLPGLTQREFSPLASGGMSLEATNLVWAGSPHRAEHEPARLGSESEAVADLSAENHFQGEDSRMADASANYANLPIDRSHANFAAACIADVTPSTSSALAAATNWAEQMEAAESGEDSFTVVKHKRRRRESPNRPVEQRSSGVAASRRTGATPRRRPTAGEATVVQEIRATRADIADARVQQRSSTEDNCVFVEHCPDFGYTHYLQAVEELVGGAGNVLQVMKMDGHMLVGLSTKALAERLLRDGLEIGHTHLRAFPFKKRAERITVANLPFFVDDATIIEALKPFGDVSSIAPIRLRAGRCGRQGHRRANCPINPGRASNNGQPQPAPLPPGASSTVSRQQSRPTPAAPALPMEETPSAPPPVTPAPPLQAPEGPVGPRPAGSQHPEPPPARPDLVAPLGPLPAQKTLGPAAPTPDVEMSINKAQRKGPLLSPPQCDALAGLIRQILDLRPGAASNLYKVLGQVKAELRTTPTAVSPIPPLPAPRPAEPTPPAPHGKMTTPALATSPLFQVEEDLTSKRWDEAADIIYKLCNERYSGPLTDLGITEGDITDAVIYPEDREPLLRTCSTQKKNLITEIISAAIERARDSDPF
ncbi:hypothetical protein LAZ67_21000232, partial [Cordylochernes scorpioides]